MSSEDTNAVIVPIPRIISSVDVNAKPNLRILSRLAPNMTGMARKNVNSAATVRDTPSSSAPTMAPLTDLWGIGTDNARVPAQSEIDEALTHVGYQNVKLLGNNQVQLLNGAQVDLGGIGKGYAGDIVHEMAESDTSDQWHVLARLSGNIEMYGGKTADSGTDNWNIGIADPDDNTDSIAVVSLRDGSVVTSGDYERFFKKDGKRYHHIFDPATGYPADSGLRGVTVIDPCSTKADALTTALFVMGLDKGMKFCEENKIAAVFITADKQVYTTSALGGYVSFEFLGAEKGFTLC